MNFQQSICATWMDTEVDILSAYAIIHMMSVNKHELSIVSVTYS